jgi:hypothetical protein
MKGKMNQLLKINRTQKDRIEDLKENKKDRQVLKERKYTAAHKILILKVQEIDQNQDKNISPKTENQSIVRNYPKPIVYREVNKMKEKLLI